MNPNAHRCLTGCSTLAPCLLAIAVLPCVHAQTRGGEPDWFDGKLGSGLEVPEGGFAMEIAVADVNADGVQDLLVQQEDRFDLMLGDVWGGFELAVGAVPEVAAGNGHVATGDVDSDGDLDAVLSVVLSFLPPPRMFILLNDGSGQFSTDSAIAGGHGVLADVNDDGHLDLVEISAGRYRPGDGTGAFGAIVPILEKPLNDLLLEDFDGDGDLDAFELYQDSQTDVLLNNGTLGFAHFQSLAKATDGALGDYDADGDADLVLAGFYGYGRSVYRNNPTGFVQTQTLPALQDSSDADANDYDGDGDLDVIVARQAISPEVWRNNGAGFFDEQVGVFPDTLPLGTFFEVVFFDADGDHDEDVLGVGFEPTLLLSNGKGYFLEADPTPDSPAELANAKGLADVDGDGDLDVLNPQGEQPVQDWLYRNDGFGNLSSDPGPAPVLSDWVSAYDLGDLDLDGDTDAFVGRYDVGILPIIGLQSLPVKNTVLKNDGSGAFGEAPHDVVAFPDTTADVLLFDIEGDGDLDAFSANRSTISADQINRILTNDATGVLTLDPALLPLSINGFRVRSGDFNLDGSLDIFIGRRPLGEQSVSDYQSQLYLNDGSGSFSDATQTHLPVVGVNLGDLLVEDVDLDADLDVYHVVMAFLASGLVPQADVLLLNDGSAHFADASANLPPLGYDGQAAVFTDVDLDGDRDLLKASTVTTSPVTEFYVNDGHGLFSAAPDPLPPGQAPLGAMAAVDLDRDGDEDLLSGSGFFRALRREVVPLSTLRIGEDFGLELLSAGTSAPYALAFSTTPAWYDLAELGVLGLGAPLTVLATGLLEGSAELSIPVPDQPALVGIEVRLQAVMDEPLHLSRLVVSTVTDL
jgi:hypothetical protein